MMWAGMMSVAEQITARLKGGRDGGGRGRREGGRKVLVVGRAGMDLYPMPDGATIGEAGQFISDVGGSAGNIAVALARLECPVMLLSAFSDDAIGRFVANALTAYGVDIALCPYTEGLERTSLAIAESRPDKPSVVIYRNNAADLTITEAAVEGIDMAQIGAVIITGTALSAEPSRMACMVLAEQAQAAGCPLVFDIDYRPQAWASLDEARIWLGQMAVQADMVVANDEEFDVIAEYEHDDKGGICAETLALGGRLILYKMGRGGCDIMGGETIAHIGIFDVATLKPFGAGDAFLGGVMSGLADGFEIEAAVERGAAAAAIVVGRRGCASAMPNRDEIEALRAGSND